MTLTLPLVAVGAVLSSITVVPIIFKIAVAVP